MSTRSRKIKSPPRDRKSLTGAGMDAYLRRGQQAPGIGSTGSSPGSGGAALARAGAGTRGRGRQGEATEAPRDPATLEVAPRAGSRKLDGARSGPPAGQHGDAVADAENIPAEEEEGHTGTAASQEDKKSPDLYMDAVNGTNQNQQHPRSDPSAPPSRQSEAGTQEDRKLPETRMDTGEGMNQNLQPAQSDPSAHPPRQSDPSAHPPQQSDPSAHPPQQSDPSAHPPQQSDPSAHPPQQSDPSDDLPRQSEDILNGEKTERMEEGEAATPDSSPPPETLYENIQHYAFAPDPAPEESMQHAQPGATLSNAANCLNPYIKEEPDMRGARGPGTADIQDQEMKETSEVPSDKEMESDKESSDNEESRMPRNSRTSGGRTQSQHPKKERKALYKTHERMRKSKDTPDGPAKMQPSDNTLLRAQQELADSL